MWHSQLRTSQRLQSDYGMPAPRSSSSPATMRTTWRSVSSCPCELLEEIREHDLMYEQDAHGANLHQATEVLRDRAFFEIVQRLDGYDGYGRAVAPIRMAAHHRAGIGRSAKTRAQLSVSDAVPEMSMLAGV